MPGVPDNVLNWLHSVLRNEYRDVQRAYSDIAKLLAAYPTIRPRTEIYTYENGVSALLVLLGGTVPVHFRGQTYQFPIQIWVPHDPRDPPMCYVKPAEGMVVRPGQHVSGDGRIYHPYLAKWPGFWDKSSLVDLVAILRDVFAKEPPVMSKQQIAQTPAQVPFHAAPTPPPPLPPPPEDRRQQPPPPPPPRPQPGVGSPAAQAGGPPPLPPKGSDSLRHSSMSPPVNGRMQSPNQGPPLPPLPHLHTSQHRPPPPGPWHDPAVGQPPPRPSYQPSRQSSLREQAAPYTPTTTLPPHMRHHELESPVSPITPQENLPPPPPPQQFGQYPPQYRPDQGRQPQQQVPPPPQGTYHHQPPQQQAAPPYQQPPPLPQDPRYLPANRQQPLPIQQRLPQPQIDLLSSPLDVQLPGQPGADISTTPAPVPPVPPNPQKDALLHAISQALVSQANQTLSNNSAAFQSLSAQHQALLAAQQTLQTELDSLAHLSSVLDSNDTALRQGIQQIDASISAASSQRRPEIDAIIISPTIVGQQVYNAVAEEQAARDVRLALGRALDKGRIGVKEYVKEMRGVGREEFFRKALVRKAGVGMGLEVGSLGAS